MADVLLITPASAPEQGELAEEFAQLEQTLAELQNALCNLLLASRTTRAQAEQWLVNSLAALFVTDPDTKRRRFTQFLHGGSAFVRGGRHEPLAHALLGVLAEAQPAALGRLLAREPGALRRFFKRAPDHVSVWFGHFSMGGMREFKHGAYALARYALAHRDTVWRLLEWRGKHPQAPVAVAQRLHYFCELDVQRSVANLVRECPEFWESEEMAEATASGAILAVDPGAWVKELAAWLEEHSSRGDALYTLLCSWLESPVTPWRSLCQRLLPALPRDDLLRFAAGLLERAPFVSSSAAGGGHAGGGPAATAGPADALPAAWLVLRGVHWQSLDDLVIAAAAGCSMGQLARLLREEEQDAQAQQLWRLVRRMHAAPPAVHWRLRTQLRRREEAERQQEQEAQRRRRSKREAGQSPSSRQEEEEGATPAAVELHRCLLLQLLAAGLAVQEAATSREHGSAATLQSLLAAGGVCCELIGGQSEDADDEDPLSASKHKQKKRRHSTKKQRRKEAQQKRRKSGRSERSHDSDGDSDSGHRSGGAEGSGKGADASAVAAPDARWELHWPGSGGSSAERQRLSTFELVDAVLRRVAAAYADWRFGSH